MTQTFRFEEKGSVVLKRWNAERQALKTARRSFAGAAVSRLTASFASWSNALNSDLDGALPILRARARDLCANHEYGRRFLTMVATNLVGAAGPTLQVRAYNQTTKPREQATLDKPANGAIEMHWWRWGKVCDLAGRMTLPQMLRVIVKAVARDGEAVVRKVRGREFSYGMRLQLLEADRLDEALNQRTSGGNVIRMGVEVDSTLRAVALWLFTEHPGENASIGSSGRRVERVPMSEIYHLFVPERAEQVRGYSWLHAVLTRARMLQGYEEAAIIAARVGAAKMGVLKRPDDASGDPTKSLADGQDATTGQFFMSAEPGEFAELPPGWELQSWNPDYPHQNFGEFVKSCLRGMAAGLDVDYPTLANDLEGVNYSSIRAGTLETREVWISLQEWLIDSFLLPLYRDWLTIALPMGAITFDSGARLPAERLDKFIDAARFQGRRWQWVDPLKDAQASRELIAAGLSSRTEIAASQGRDFVDIIDDLASEAALMRAAGIENEPAAPAPVATEEEVAEEKDMRRRHISALEQAALKPNVINVTSPPVNVTVERTAVNVEPARVTVEPTTVNVEAPNVVLEATIPPAEVVMTHPSRAVVTHEHDAAGELVRSVTTYETTEGK